MNVLPREVTTPWESNCRRCRLRVLAAFDVNGQGVFLDAEPALGGDVELAKLSVGFRMRTVTASGQTDRYVRHQCAAAQGEQAAPSETGDEERVARHTVMPFGKHAGEYLEDIPTGYLRWALERDVFRSPHLRRAAELVVQASD